MTWRLKHKQRCGSCSQLNGKSVIVHICCTIVSLQRFECGAVLGSPNKGVAAERVLRDSVIAVVADWLCGRMDDRVGSHPLNPAAPPSVPRLHTAKAPAASVSLQNQQLVGRDLLSPLYLRLLSCAPPCRVSVLQVESDRPPGPRGRTGFQLAENVTICQSVCQILHSSASQDLCHAILLL